MGRYEPFKSFNAGLASFTPAFRCAVEAHSDLTAEWRLIRLEADERFEADIGVSVPMTTIPTELRALDEWVVWRFERRDGKPTKVPYAVATGRRASVSDSGSWTTFDKARAFASAHADGIGFVFTEHDPFTGQRLRPAPIDREDLHLRPLPCHGERFATLAGVTQFKVEHLRRARVWWR